MEIPVLYTFDLKRTPESGYLGLYTFLNDIHFANFTFQSNDQPPLKREEKPKLETEVGTITSWEISSPFLFADLENEVTLPDPLSNITSWKTMTTEPTGTINLAAVGKVNKEQNTVFAKVTVNSDKQQTKALHIGYSDAIKVYINGKILYGGHNRFRSRDYRYLGTIGYFDTVYVPLEEGENEIRVAISETMGGWGIKAKWGDTEGLSL